MRFSHVARGSFVPSAPRSVTVLPAGPAIAAALRRLRTRRGTAAAVTLLGLASLGVLAGANAGASTVTVAPTFTAGSWWNTPLPANAPEDIYSPAYIADSQNPLHSQNYLKLSIGSWGAPMFTATAADPVYTVSSGTYGSGSVTLHIPAAARPQPTSDAAITIYDSATNQVVGMWGAAFDATKNVWTARGIDRYYLTSEGVAAKSGGTKGNTGHRGISGSFRGVRQDEVLAGAIRHRLEVFWWATAGQTPEGASAYWPMTGSEQGKGGIVPEGIVLRIRPDVDLSKLPLTPAALVVAQALQTYGAIVGDNSGSGNNLKVQSNVSWAGLLDKDSLKSIPWSDYQFVQGGYRP